MIPRPIRTLFSVIGLVLSGIVAVLAAVVSLLLCPPQELIRRAVIQVGRTVTDQTDLEIHSLSLNLLSGIEVTGFYMGGFKQFAGPFLTFDRFTLKYDLSGWRERRFVIDTVELVRPTAWLERRQNVINWKLFAEHFPSKKEEPRSEGLPFHWRLNRFQIDDAAAIFSGEEEGGALQQLGIWAQAQGGGDTPVESAEFAVKWTTPDRDRANIVGFRRGRPDILVRARSELSITTKAEQVASPRAKVAVDWQIAALTQQGLGDLPLPTFSLAADTNLDMSQERAELTSLIAKLNDQQVLAMHGVVDRLQGDQHATIAIDEAQISFATLQPYVAIFAPYATLSGTIRANKIEIETTREALVGGAAPRVTGHVDIEKVGVAVSAHRLLPPGVPVPLTLTDVNGTLDFVVDQGQGQVMLDVGFNGLSSPLVNVRQFHVDSASKIKLVGLVASDVANFTELNIGSIALFNPAFGKVALSLHSTIELDADLMHYDVRRFFADVTVPNLCHATLTATAKNRGQDHLQAEWRLADLEIGRLVNWLPPALRQKVPLKEGKGTLSLAGHIEGRWPQGYAPRPADFLGELPVQIKTTAVLEGIELITTDDLGARVSNLNADAVLDVGKGIALDGNLQIDRLSSAVQGVTVAGLRAPIHLALNGARLDLTTNPTIERIQQITDRQSVDVQTMAIKGDVAITAPWSRVLEQKVAPFASLSVNGNATINTINLTQNGQTTAVSKLSTKLKTNYEDRGSHLSEMQTSFDLAVDDVFVTPGNRRLRNVALSFAPHVTAGVHLAAPTSTVDIDRLSAELSTSLHIGEIEAGLAWPMTLQDTSARGLIGIRRGRDLFLKELSLSVPSLGASVVASGFIHALPLAPPTTLPEFNLTVDAKLDRADKVARLDLHPGFKLTGAAGFDLNIHPVSPTRLALVGHIKAKELNVQGQREIFDNKAQGLREQRASMVDVNADIPIDQQLDVDLATGTVAIPPALPKTDVIASLPVMYATLRPYAAHRSNVTLERIIVHDKFTSAEPGPDGVVPPPSEREFTVGPLSADLEFSQGGLALNYYSLHVFDGNLMGSLQVYLLDLLQQNFSVKLDTRATNVDLAYLSRDEKPGSKGTKISMVVGLNYLSGRQDVSGRILITDISLRKLDALLASLDPHERDPGVQSNRRLLNAWYTKMVNPKVKQVTIWFSHSKLNMDIDIDAVEPFGTALRYALKKTRIRRVAIAKFLPKVKAANVPQ